MLKGNIVLPEYQRFFVWDKTKVIKLIETLKAKEFVPPITIGAFYENGTTQNLILDGQQRLTSILLAHLSLYPDKDFFRNTLAQIGNDNDDELDDEDQLDNILDWDFRKLAEKGRTKEEILSRVVTDNYRQVNYEIDEDFLKSTFLGFSYLVPNVHDQRIQQKYYSSVFRNINIQGVALLAMESRASLYFLNRERKEFFDPLFMSDYVLRSSNVDSKIDFLRYTSLLSQYAINSNSAGVARGFKSNMEKYYEEYIHSVANDDHSDLFKDFSVIFPQGNYNTQLGRLRTLLNDLEIHKQFHSIIDADLYMFGLIYYVLFENKTIDIARKDELTIRLQDAMSTFRGDYGHRRAPSALKYLRARMDSSIEIYDQYTNE